MCMHVWPTLLCSSTPLLPVPWRGAMLKHGCSSHSVTCTHTSKILETLGYNYLVWVHHNCGLRLWRNATTTTNPKSHGSKWLEQPYFLCSYCIWTISSVRKQIYAKDMLWCAVAAKYTTRDKLELNYCFENAAVWNVHILHTRPWPLWKYAGQKVRRTQC